MRGLDILYVTVEEFQKICTENDVDEKELLLSLIAQNNILLCEGAVSFTVQPASDTLIQFLKA